MSLLGTALLSALPSEATASGATSTLLVDDFRQSTDKDDTASFSRAIAAARAAGGGVVSASPGVLYRVSPAATFVSLNPSGGTCRYNVCIQLAPGVALDMQGSTLQLQGPTEAAIVTNSNVTGTGTRDSGIGLANAVIDGNNVVATYHSLLHMAYIDGLALQGVKIIRGTLQGGWIYNCTASSFDGLDADQFVGQAWSIGSPLGNNQVFDSKFGSLKAQNIAKIDSNTLPGNSFDLALVRCSIGSIEASACAAGVKLQWPSRDITVGTVTVDTCGDHDGNSGFKIQGDPTYGPVSRVAVASVVSRNQTGPGLFMERCQDCSVTSYLGTNNNLNGNSGDVWIGGANDHVGVINSSGSGGNAIVVRPYATGYQLPQVIVVNAGRSPVSANRSGVGVYGGSGSFGTVVCVDNQALATMTRGVDVAAANAIGSIVALNASGQRTQAFNSVSQLFKAPVAGANHDAPPASTPSDPQPTPAASVPPGANVPSVTNPAGTNPGHAPPPTTIPSHADPSTTSSKRAVSPSRRSKRGAGSGTTATRRIPAKPGHKTRSGTSHRHHARPHRKGA